MENNIINLDKYSDVLSVNAAAKSLELSRTAVYRLLDVGYIKEIVISDKRMITKQSVEYYKYLKTQISIIEAQIEAIAKEG